MLKKIKKEDIDLFIYSNVNPEKYKDNPQYKEYLDFCSNGYWIGGYKW